MTGRTGTVEGGGEDGATRHRAWLDRQEWRKLSDAQGAVLVWLYLHRHERALTLRERSGRVRADSKGGKPVKRAVYTHRATLFRGLAAAVERADLRGAVLTLRALGLVQTDPDKRQKGQWEILRITIEGEKVVEAGVGSRHQAPGTGHQS